MFTNQMIDPREPSKKLTQSELFKRATDETTFKLSQLDFTQEDSYKKLEEWIDLIQSINFEATAVGVRLSEKKRELDAKSGKNRWDKEVREINKSNKSFGEVKEKKPTLSQLEKIVHGFIQSENTEESEEERDDYILGMVTGKKYKSDEVKEAIKKVRSL